MRKTTTVLCLFGALLLPALASAQATAHASVELSLGLPVVLPQLVVVTPGIMIVPDMDEEVFYTGGYYWVLEDGLWYRSRSHRGGWVVVPGRGVPPGLARLPPGHYRHWKGPPPGAYRGGGPAYRGGGPAYRGGGPVYRGGGPVVRGGGPVYRGGGPVYRGGGPVYRGGERHGDDGGRWKRGGGDGHGDDGDRWKRGGKHD